MRKKSGQVSAAFDLLKKKFDTVPSLCGVLGISNTYMYRAIKDDFVSLPLSLKIEILTEGKFKWETLADRKVVEDIKSVESHLR